MSKHVFIVDLPSLCFYQTDTVYTKLVIKLMEILPKMRNVEVLARKQMSAIIYSCLGSYDSYYSSKFLMNVHTYLYSESELINGLQILPDIKCNNDGVNEEILVQCSVMHGRLNSEKHTYLTFKGRWNFKTGILKTSVNNTNKKHSVVIFTSESEIDKFKLNHEPKLNQQKHRHSAYLSNGKQIAPFTLWNNNNQQPAKDLLRKAFEDCDYDNGTFPHVLYGWDSSNGVWVKFNHNSRNAEDYNNREYHGYDLKNHELNEVPDNLKKKYNHWTNIKEDWKI